MSSILEAVVVAVTEAAGDAAMQLDEAVDRLRAPVVRAACLEVAEELAAPLLQRVSEAGDLGDGAGAERGDDLLGDRAPGVVGVLVVAGADLLGALPGDLNLEVFLPSGERGLEPGALPVGEVLFPSAQDVPDPVERVAPAAAVAGGVLLHPASEVIDDLRGELDHVERVEHRAGVLELVVDRVLVPMKRV
jgi:hypothetical protein